MTFNMNRNLFYSILSFLLLGVLAASAQPKPRDGGGNHPNGKTVVGQRMYQLTVKEGDKNTITAFNRGLDSIRNVSSDRNLISDLAAVYKSTAAGQAVSLTGGLLDLGFNSIISATKSKRPEWEKAVRGESTFVRRLPMQMEILDFYQSPSLNGPLDPTDMNFRGFGCQQFIEYSDTDGSVRVEPVFYVSCSVKTDPAGRARMLHHSKFEVEVDSLYFNYAICDLPNDSLGVNTENRIDFSLESRSNLKFIVDANITSSWINQALMVFNDQPLGSFRIVASIDPDLTKNGVFTYNKNNVEDKVKDVKVSGDCFLVPRSYVGSSDMANVQDSWGTGQYKVEMTVTETCSLNEQHYKTNGKWDSSKWKPEWNKIKKRRHTPSAWQQAWSLITNQYSDNKWVTILVEPAKTAFIQYETDGINRLINPGTVLAGESAKGSMQSTQNNSAQGNNGGQTMPQH